MDPLFAYHRLTEDGVTKLLEIRNGFDDLVKLLNRHCPANTREIAIAKTALEKACMYAVKAVSMLRENQDLPGLPTGQARYETRKP